MAQEKGSSSWLTCLPLKNLGYYLNKEEFRDSIAMRYGWSIEKIPKSCACGKKNDIDHILTCPLGGYTHLRHNSLRDTFAKLLSTFCYDVQGFPQCGGHGGSPPHTWEILGGYFLVHWVFFTKKYGNRKRRTREVF